MFEKTIKLIYICGIYTIGKTIFKLGEEFGRAREAMRMIKNESNNLRSNLKYRKETMYS